MGNLDDEGFVGRTAESAAIASALHGATERTHLICVSGPAGIGKTTLAAHAVSPRGANTSTHASTDPPARAAWTRCWNGPGTPALWPWRQLLTELGVAIDVATAATNTTTAISTTTNAHTTTSTPSAEDRFAQFDRICADLCTLSLKRPLTVIIDDIHWADRASLELLHFVARHPRPSALRIIATFRDDEASSGDHASIIATIEREAQSFRLAGLDSESIGSIANRLGIESADTVRSVTDRTAGNPFFATELLRQLADTGIDAEQPVPTSIRALLDSQLALIEPNARAALEAAAVQGEVFSASTLAAATRIEPFELEEMLEAAQRSRLVARHNGDWSFAHALIGETLLEELSPHDIARHHLATADAIEKQYGLDDPAHIESLANHVAAAAGLATPDRMIAVSLIAAGVARRQLAFETESTLLKRAIELLRSTDHTSELLDALIARCVAEKAAGNFDEAVAVGLEAADVAQLSNDPVGLGRVALVFPPDTEGVELDQTYNADQARLREAALATLPDDQAVLRCQLQAAHAMSLYWSESPTEAERHHHATLRRDTLTADALHTAEQLGDDHTLAIALHARIYANWGPSTDSTRLELALRLVAVADRIGDSRLALAGRVWRITDHLTNNRLVEADIDLEAFESEAQRNVDRYQLWSAMRIRANIAFMRGDVVEMERLASEAFKFGRTFLPNDAALHFYSAMLGPVAFVRGVFGDTLDFVRDMAIQNSHVPAWRIGYAIAAAEAGEVDTARSELDAIAANDFAMFPRDLDFFTSLASAAAVALITKNREAALSIIRHVQPRSGLLIVHGIGYTHYGSFDLALGQCADALDRVDEARSAYERSIEQLDIAGSKYRSYARLLLGRLISTHDPITARRVLSEAVDQFESYNAERMVDRCHVALSELDALRTVTLSEAQGGWRLAQHGAEVVELPDLKGFRALQELLVHPNQSRHALVLAAIIEGHGSPLPVTGDQLELADEQAMAHYRSRLAELDHDLDAADRSGDTARSERLHEEFDALTDELRRVRGFAGHSTTAPNDADRARVNVTKHVKRAIERIAEADSSLGEMLRESITTGMHCSYVPGSTTTTIWAR